MLDRCHFAVHDSLTMCAAPLKFAALILIFPAVALAGPKTEVLHRASEIRNLSRDQAAKGLPLEIQGMVTYAYNGDSLQNFIIEQDGIGIFINVRQERNVLIKDKEGILLPADAHREIREGTEVIVRGITWKGQFAPVADPFEVLILGQGTLPPARPYALDEILNGSMDCQRLEIRGVVQGAEIVENLPIKEIRFKLAIQGGRVAVECQPPGNWTAESLLGASVRVSAVALTYFNARGEILGVHFRVADPKNIVIEKPAPADPFAVPLVPITALQPFSPDGFNLERVKICGQVTLSRPGDYFYIEDQERAVRVFTRDPTHFQLGDWVVASGFIDLHQSFAELREAAVQRISQGEIPKPLVISYGSLVSASERKWGQSLPVDYNGRLISVQCTLAKVEATSSGAQRIYLTSHEGALLATLSETTDKSALAALLPGSEVRVTGICELQFPSTQFLTDFPNPTGFSLQLRSPQDVSVLRSATWWTARRLWVLLGSTGGLLALALIWNLLLRRLVRQRSSQLATEMRARDRVEIEFDATLRERTRLAADLHDTLEQALTGLAFQLDTSKVLSTKAPDISEKHLELGRQLLTRSREDLRRSIWNLRARELDEQNFADAIRSAAHQAAEGRPMTIRVEEQGDPQPLTEFVAGNLLLLAQEAMTNAIKHGKSETITIDVSIEYGEESLILHVRDDGAGFDPKHAPGLHEGHFGLQGMRERANRLDGSVEIESRSGNGTRITVRVPLPAAVPAV